MDKLAICILQFSQEFDDMQATKYALEKSLNFESKINTGINIFYLKKDSEKTLLNFVLLFRIVRRNSIKCESILYNSFIHFFNSRIEIRFPDTFIKSRKFFKLYPESFI